MAIEGDLRFLSHHDMMRAIERIATRAKLPLRYSQGFNPRPVLSLSCPRPVGVASQDDLLVLALEEELRAEELCERMNAHAPRGLRFLRANVLDAKSLLPIRVDYELSLVASQHTIVADRLGVLMLQECWPIERPGKPRPPRRGKPASITPPRKMDLRPMLECFELRDNTLYFSLVAHDAKWAKPMEVLKLVGLDSPETLACLVRTKIATEP